MFNMHITVSVPITSRNLRQLGEDKYQVGVIVSEKSEELSEKTYGKWGTVNAATTFLVDGYDNIPFRGDSVDVCVDCATGEGSIIWENGWYEG